jgi:hypothetical protein
VRPVKGDSATRWRAVALAGLGGMVGVMGCGRVGAVVVFVRPVSTVCAGELVGAGWQVMSDRRIWRHLGVEPRAVCDVLDRVIEAEPGLEFQARQGPMVDGELWVARYSRSLGRVDGLTDPDRPGLFAPRAVSELLEIVGFGQ